MAFGSLLGDGQFGGRVPPTNVGVGGRGPESRLRIVGRRDGEVALDVEADGLGDGPVRVLFDNQLTQLGFERFVEGVLVRLGAALDVAGCLERGWMLPSVGGGSGGLLGGGLGLLGADQLGHHLLGDEAEFVSELGDGLNRVHGEGVVCWASSEREMMWL